MQLKLFHIQNTLLFYFLTLCTAPLLFENCYAHDLSLVRAAVSIPANGEMEISLVADIPSIATKLSGVDNPLELTSSQLSNSFSQLKRELAEETEIIVDSSRLDISEVLLPSESEFRRTVLLTENRFAHDARGCTIVLRAKLPADSAAISFKFPDMFENIMLVVAKPDAPLWLSALTRGAKSSEFALQGVQIPEMQESTPQYWLLFSSYLKIGFFHILPLGLDHILFIVGLFLLSVHWKPLLGQVTAFTIAHTLTLGMATAGIFSLPASTVEPLIALSIVIIGVENIFVSRLHRHRILIVFIFGLLHGLGFAGVLETIGLPQDAFFFSLLAFNLGVEFGQIAVIALCFLFLGKLMKGEFYRRNVVIPGSIAIAVISLYWFFERI